MKFFNCEDCTYKKNWHQNNHHCPFYKEIPSGDFCPTYTKEYIPFFNYNELIEKKSIDLYNSYSDVTEYDIMDWMNIIRSELNNSILQDDVNTIKSFINRFGVSGLFFACNNCDTIIELDDDINVRCNSCGSKKFSFYSI
jgi:rubrerythrin